MVANVSNLNERRGSKKLLVYFLVASIIILLGTTGYFYYQYNKLTRSPAASQIAAAEEARDLVVKVGKLMLLPKDEGPTVATVTDVNKLKDQFFFKNAKNGNKVLIFPNAKIAVIYDPKDNLIINAGFVDTT